MVDDKVRRYLIHILKSIWMIINNEQHIKKQIMHYQMKTHLMNTNY